MPRPPRGTASFLVASVLLLGAAVFPGTLARFVDTPNVSGNVFQTRACFGSHVVSGSYLGNGIDNRAITGVGLAPDLVIVKSRTTGAATGRTSTMVGDVSKALVNAHGLEHEPHPVTRCQRLHRRHEQHREFERCHVFVRRVQELRRDDERRYVHGERRREPRAHRTRVLAGLRARVAAPTATRSCNGVRACRRRTGSTRPRPVRTTCCRSTRTASPSATATR